MSERPEDNSAQIEYWNGKAGERWAGEAERLDAMLAPFLAPVLSAAGGASGKRVLDVGCGSGSLSLAALEAGAAHVTGVDVSAPMLGLARRRAGETGAADFIQADASEWSSDMKFDALVSRFGVMFFADPPAAFANLRQAMAPGGCLAFACWQPLKKNDWAAAPLQAVMPLLDQPPPRPEPGTPGPFAFEDADRTVGLLARAGWQNPGATPWTGSLTMPGASIDETARFMTDMGPASRLIAEHEIDADEVFEALRGMLKANAGSDGRVSLPAAAWIITAEA
ncbi:MAG: class I SAM-dependent methyltransferase [Henriciella sp.]|uniref:class I SAM-dependent methyltransferase n=1 Tax=Henriciella sp. TaxID=1968823 RepID=UPI003C737532